MNTMKRYLTITLIFCSSFYPANCQAQPYTSWIATWDSQHWDEIHTLTTDEFNNSYVAGWSYEWGVNYDFVFAKFNSAGVLQWSKIRNYTSGDKASKILCDNNGNIYIGGFVKGEYNSYGGNLCLMKYTTNGDSIWEFVDTTYLGADLKSMSFDKDGNIILSGCFSTSLTASNFVTLKVDTTGNVLWRKPLENLEPHPKHILTDMCTDKTNHIYVSIAPDDSVNHSTAIITLKYNSTGDTMWKRIYPLVGNIFNSTLKVKTDELGDVYISGTIEHHNPCSSDLLLLKYDSLGNSLWEKYYDYAPASQSIDQLTDLQIDGNGNSYLCGKTYYSNADSSARILILKFSTSGNLIWSKTWGKSVELQPQQMLMDSFSNLYITGYFYDTSDFEFHGITLKYDSSGVLIWHLAYEGDTAYHEDQLYTIALDNNNDLIVAGRTRSSTDFDFASIKYQNGPIGIKFIENGAVGLHLSCHPSVFEKSTLINYYLPFSQNVTLKIFNISGIEVADIKDLITEEGNHLIPFEANGLIPGIYFCKLESNTATAISKILVVKSNTFK